MSVETQSPITSILREAFDQFMASPYAGEWDQQVSIKMTANQLRLLLAHLDMLRMNDKQLASLLGNHASMLLAMIDNELTESELRDAVLTRNANNYLRLMKHYVKAYTVTDQ